jgi:hypothetical protein
MTQETRKIPVPYPEDYETAEQFEAAREARIRELKKHGVTFDALPRYVTSK